MRTILDRELRLIRIVLDKDNEIVFSLDQWNDFKNDVDSKIAKSHRF